MSAESYIKTNCPLCAGSIETPVRGLGQIISCPHCNRDIRLAQKYPFQRFLAGNWRIAVGLCVLALIIGNIIIQLPKPQQAAANPLNKFDQPKQGELTDEQVFGTQKQSAAAFLDSSATPSKLDPLGIESTKTHGDIFDKVAGNQTLTLEQANQLVSAPPIGRLNLIPIIQPNPNDEIVTEMRREDFLRRLDAIGNDYQPRPDAMTRFYQQQQYFQQQQALRDLNRLTQIQEDQNYRQILNGH